MQTLDRDRLGALHDVERERFVAQHPRSKELFERAKASLHDGVPMNWMVRWASPFPLFVETARARRSAASTATSTSTSASATRARWPATAPRHDRGRRAATPTRHHPHAPTEDAIWVGEELQRRFGLPFWQFTLSATDANRFALRLGRQITGRSKVVVHDYCYHGTVDETFAVLDDGRTVARRGSIGPQVDVGETTRVVEFNDIAGLARALEDRDVAVVLFEPALTNIGIVLPDDGYLDAVRELTRRTGTLLLIDETHTICAGPGGATKAWGLEPDLLVIGKTIGGGIPIATYGFTAEVADRIRASVSYEDADVGGSAGRSPATRCRWRPHGRRSARC
jgi:glutamate-1-semialdehyde aminotransferase